MSTIKIGTKIPTAKDEALGRNIQGLFSAIQPGSDGQTQVPITYIYLKKIFITVLIFFKKSPYNAFFSVRTVQSGVFMRLFDGVSV